MLLFYLYNVPLAFIVMLDSRGYGTGVGVFSARAARKRAEKRMTGKKKHVNYEKMTKRTLKILPAKTMARIAMRAIGHMRVSRLHADLTIGTGDAALTAQVVGLLSIIFSTLRAVTRAPGKVKIAPDFSGQSLKGEISITFSIKIGEVVLAAGRHFKNARKQGTVEEKLECLERN